MNNLIKQKPYVLPALLSGAYELQDLFQLFAILLIFTGYTE